MKMGMKTAAMASVLAFGLMASSAIAQTGTETTVPQQQMGGSMMNGNGQGMMQGQGGMGMMGGKGRMMQGNMGCMNMMGQGMGMGMMGGGMMTNMSAENQQKFMDATKKMRQNMQMMHFEHMEAMRNPKTTLEDLAAIEQKMLDIRKEMMKKAKGFQDQKN